MTALAMRFLVRMTAIFSVAVFAIESSTYSSEQNSERSQRSLSSFYTNYEHYPPYCGIPEEMGRRSIPPLRDHIGASSKSNATKKFIGETRLVHVTAVIRHGARTPWSSEMKCWDGYWDSPETGRWDCDDLTTFMAPPSRGGESFGKRDSNSTVKRGNFFLFEKRYDALEFPKDGLTNVLNGTCEMGQLLQQGYEQQIQNGKILRDAYTYTNGEYDHDERMRLLDLSLDDETNLPWQYPNHLYFRADDYQRTVMSGQVLLRALFDPELVKFQSQNVNNKVIIPLHITDKERDIVDANENDCPRLHAIKESAFQSNEFEAFYNSENSQQVRDYMQRHLNMDDEASVLDCFMCTLCTDRPLPNAVDDYDGTAQNWFSRLTEYEIQKYTTIMKYNNSEYAKLGIGPLWYEIMKNINRVVKEAGDTPKLALFAGHDTTLMPLLASLGSDLWKDTEWASYASMLLIEVHELIDGRSNTTIYTSKFAFRLLYNGKILTPLVEGCHEESELCDIVHLKAILDPIASRDIDCSDPRQVSNQYGSTSSSEEDAFNDQYPYASFTTTTGLGIFVALLILSGFGGSAITFAVMRKNYNNAVRHRRVDFDGAWDIQEAGDGEHGLELSEGAGFRDEPSRMIPS